MTTEDFVQKMNALPVMITEAHKKAYPEQQLNKLINQFKFIYKTKSEFSNNVLRLVAEYDCSNVEIGMITFNKGVEEDNVFFYFGQFEADELAFEKKTGELVLRESNANHTMGYCAKNGASFLDALYLAAQYLSGFSFGEDVTENQGVVCAKALECGQAAGGEKYVGFYKMMLGCD